MSRRVELEERRRRLWTQPWHRWEPDFEARINHLTKLIEEAWGEERKQWAGKTPGRGEVRLVQRGGGTEVSGL